MKKLMIALSAAAMFSLCAKAVDPVITGDTDFEGYEVGDPISLAADPNSSDTSIYWAGTPGDSVIKGDADNKYLAVETSSDEVLQRQLKLQDEDVGPVAIDGSITISTKVQFTAADTAPTAVGGDKLLVWALAADAEGDIHTEATTGKNVLCVTDADGIHNTGIEVKVTSDAECPWYTLALTATKEGEDLTATAKFAVTLKVDGAEEATEVGNFKSMVTGGKVAQSIASIGFKGTGNIDDIEFTGKEGYVPSAVAVALDVKGVAEVETAILNDEGEEQTNFVAGDVVTVIVALDNTYTIACEEATFNYDAENSCYIAEVELTDEMAPTLTINVTVTAPSQKTPREQLDEAMAAVVTGTPATIKLAGNVEVGTEGKRTTALTIKAGTDVTLDLAGHTITQSTYWYAIDVLNGAKLTIVDTVGGGAVTVEATKYNNKNPASMIRNKGLLTIKAGTFTTDYCVVKNDEDPGIGNLVIDGGTFTIVTNENGYTGLTWAVMNWGVATINGGTFNGDVQALSEGVNACSPESVLTINAGTFVPPSVYLRPYDKTTTPTIKVAESMKDTLTLVDTTPAAFNRKVVTTTADGYVTYKLADKAVYTVTFVADGTTVDTKEVVEGNTGVELPTEPTKEGYAFKGWFVEEVAFDATAEITADTTVTAKFEYIPVTVDVTVDEDTVGATVTVASTATEGDTLTFTVTVAEGYDPETLVVTVNRATVTEYSVTVGTEDIVIKAVATKAAQDLPGTDLLPAEDAEGYNAWAAANGITVDSTPEAGAAAALAYKMELVIPAGKTIAEAEQDAVDAAVAKIDVSKLATNLDAAVAAIKTQYPNVKVELVAVEQSEIATTAKLYKLSITLLPVAE